MTQAELAHTLYEDHEGQWVGVEEVQLLDPIPSDRVARLQELLDASDPYIAFQAACILTAWNEPEGLSAIGQMIDLRVTLRAEIAPHRTAGYDNAYDEIAYAVYLSGLSGSHPAVRLGLYRKLLALYGEFRFESKLKYALLQTDATYLAGDIVAALQRSLNLGLLYQASQLLPPLAKWAPAYALPYLPAFPDTPQIPPNPMVHPTNVAEALRYLPTPENRGTLAGLAKSKDKVVAAEAKRSIDALNEPVGRV